LLSSHDRKLIGKDGFGVVGIRELVPSESHPVAQGPLDGEDEGAWVVPLELNWRTRRGRQSLSELSRRGRPRRDAASWQLIPLPHVRPLLGRLPKP
jgi:hypothetical protein